MPNKITAHFFASLLTVALIAFTAYGKSVVPMTSVPSKTAGEPWPVDRPIRVCAIRVEFQPDSISGTTGTGLMEAGFDTSLIIDPLPHDREYFADHLHFLRHYYETVSHGAVVFDTASFAVFPLDDSDIYRLDHPMWHYNYNTDTDLLNRRLVELFVEATAKAQADVDFADYDAIFIFHAGVGKDFSLGFDLTPFDIPSAYISEDDIRGYTGDVPVPPGVVRGLILPEGENQQEALDLGVELSLNGIMIKLFGNWLGLPDLFNTKTGHSGVGRWGMMDQGSGNIFALVPAIPTAWSRIYMGWEKPLIHVPSGDGDTLRVARAFNDSAPHVIKFPVTPKEYYLIENRDADADSIGYVQLWDRNGLWMKVDLNQNIQVQEGFRVAVRASHYDFGIPGSGILLWHIDEDVINRGLADNTVNNDPDHRGVDLMEADGAQDIGREYGFATAGSGTELGIQDDAWYRNNSAHRAANRDAETEEFSDATFPSARLYDRSHTRIHLSDFSPVDTVMSFICRMEHLASAFPMAFSDSARWTTADLNADGLAELYFQTTGTHRLVQAFPDSNRVLDYALTDLHLSENTPAVDLDGNPGDELLFVGQRLGILGFDPLLPILAVSEAIDGPTPEICPAMSSDGAGYVLAVQQMGSGRIVLKLFSKTLIMTDTLTLQFLISAGDIAIYNIDSYPAQRFLLVSAGETDCIALQDDEIRLVWEMTDSRISGVPIVISNPDTTAIYFNDIGYLNAVDGVLISPASDCDPPQVDWDGNGISDGGGWLGKNRVAREDAPSLSSQTQWICDIDADGAPDLLGLDWQTYTRIAAIEHAGSRYPGFPLAANQIDRNRCPFRFGSDNALYLMNVMVGDSNWSYTPIRLTDAANTTRFDYTEPVHIINIGPYRYTANTRSDWLYCWPNPASSVSYFRISIGYPATVTIRIFDLAGRMITELQDASTLPEPFEVGWDVSGVESGVYIGLVKVSGSGGNLESHVKIAVVK